MDLTTAERIVEASGGELELHTDYSGRGMYGKTTAGVSGDLVAIIQTIAEASYEAGSEEEPALTLSSLRFDDLGRGVIVY